MWIKQALDPPFVNVPVAQQAAAAEADARDARTAFEELLPRY